MDPLKQNRILAGLVTAQQENRDIFERLGFWEKKRTVRELAFLVATDAKMLAHLGEEKSNRLPDFTLAEEQIAKMVIRILAVSGELKLSVPAAVIALMDHNEKVSQIIKNEKV